MDNFFTGFFVGILFITILDLLLIPASFLSSKIENFYISRLAPASYNEIYRSFTYRLLFDWRFLR